MSARGTRSRRAAVPVLAGLLGVGAVVGAAALPWLTQRLHDPLSGPVTVSVPGSQRAEAMVPLILVALAGIGAVLATRGIFRRFFGGTVAAAGIAVAGVVVAAMSSPTEHLVRAALIRPAEPVEPVQTSAAGPVLAILGAVLVAAAGTCWLLRPKGRTRLGVKFQPPAARRDAARDAARAAARASVSIAGADDANPDALWQAFDAGIDPTFDAASGDAAETDTMSRPECGSGGSPIR